jgi:SAM-dependent methyltransferase
MTIRSKLAEWIRASDSLEVLCRNLNRPERVVDLGCGKFATALAYLKARFPDTATYGLDIIPAERMQANLDDYREHDLNCPLLPYEAEMFDAIVLRHVIEHLAQPLRLGSEINRLLKRGGLLYVEAPNFTSMFLPSFEFGIEQGGPFNFWDDPHHVRPYTRRSLWSFIELSGLHVERVSLTRNWRRAPQNLIEIGRGFCRSDRNTVISALWNLYGWCVFGIGRKS